MHYYIDNTNCPAIKLDGESVLSIDRRMSDGSKKHYWGREITEYTEIPVAITVDGSSWQVDHCGIVHDHCGIAMYTPIVFNVNITNNSEYILKSSYSTMTLYFKIPEKKTDVSVLYKGKHKGVQKTGYEWTSAIGSSTPDSAGYTYAIDSMPAIEYTWDITGDDWVPGQTKTFRYDGSWYDAIFVYFSGADGDYIDSDEEGLSIINSPEINVLECSALIKVWP